MQGKLTMDKRIFDIVRPETLALDIQVKMNNPDALVLWLRQEPLNDYYDTTTKLPNRFKTVFVFMLGTR